MRRLSKWCLVLVLAVVAPVLYAPSASALDPAVGFTADALPTWQTNGTVWSMANAQGKVFAGGVFTAVRAPGLAEGDPSSLTRTNLVVLDAATGAPTSCVLNATRASGGATVRAIAAAPDGATVYIAGLFSQVNGLNRQNIAAIDVATCSVKPFNPLPSSFVYALTVTEDRVYLGGAFTTLGGQPRSRLGAVTTAGALLPWAPVADDEVFALATDPQNGNVIIGGRMNTINDQDSHALAIVDSNNGLNVHNYPKPFIPWTPGTGQRQGTSVIKVVTTDSNGFYIGAEGTGGGLFDGRAAFDWNTYEQRWRDTCLGATQALAAVNGVLYVGNHAHDCSTSGLFEDGVRHYLNAQRTSDKTSVPWWPNTNAGIGEGIGPRAMTAANTTSGQYLWTGGEFTTVNGVNQRGLTRFGTGPDTGAPDTPQTPNAYSTAPGQVRVTWRATQDNDDANLTYYLYRGTSTTPIATLPATSQFWSRPQLTYLDSGLTPGSTYSYKVRASDGTNLSGYSLSRSVTVASQTHAYASQVQADGASIYFRMEEPNVTAAGNQGSATTLGGSYVNATTRSPGALIGSSDTATTFDGSTSSAFLRTDVRIPGPATYGTELWFKTSSTTGGKLIGFGNRAAVNGVGSTLPLSATPDRHVYMRNDGKLVFGTLRFGVASTLTSTAAYNDNQWHHLVAGQDASGMSMYVDATRVGRNGVTTNQILDGYWRIGGDSVNSTWPSPPTSPYFNGSVDEAAVYPKPLTVAQIRSHYQLSGRSVPGTTAPTDAYGSVVYADSPELYWRLGESTGSTATDSSGNQHTATYSLTGVTRNAGGAVAGTTDTAITTNGLTGLVSGTVAASSPAAFSEELWFKTTTTTGGKLAGWGSSATGNSTTYDKHLYLGNDGKLRFGVYANSTYTVVTSPTALNNGAWHHVVGTQDGSGQKLYVDGVAVASNAVTTNQAGTGYWRVGGDSISASWPGSPTSKYIAASIDEVAVYLNALSASQVAAHRAIGIGQAAPDTQAPTSPTGLVANPAGGSVVLNWTAASDNVGVTRYQVHRSTTSGFTPTSTTLVGEATGTSFTDAAPPAGTSYYVVTAFDAAGNVSAPSSQAAAGVPDTTPPSAPTGLTAGATGSSVNLAWTAANDNVGVIKYQVHRSTTSNFSPTPATSVGEVTGTSTVNAPPADGTYYYKVRAVDAAGNVSPASNEASVAVITPDTTPPSAPGDATGTRSGANVTLGWTASTDNVGVVRYDVHRSTTAGFTPTPGTKVADSTTTGYVDSGLATGTYHYRIVAVDAAGNVSALSREVTVVVDLTAPSVPTGLTAQVDGSTVTLDWTASTDDVGVSAYDVYRSTASDFDPSPATLIGTTGSPGYVDLDRPTGTFSYRVVARDAGGNASDASAPVAAVIPDTTAPSAPTNVATQVNGSDVVVTWTAATDNVAVTGYRVYRSTSASFTPGPSTLVATVTATGLNDAGRPAGTSYYKIVAVDGAGNASAPSAAEPATVADSTPPSVPANLTATVSSSTVALSWDPASDDVAVTGYQVHRSTSGATFTPSAATKIADVTSTSFSDPARPVGTYYYKVIARDATGNLSAPSDSASAQVASQPTIQTVTLVPVEDTYANKGAPSTNYGTSSSAASRGGTSPYTAYLKFNVAPAPAGATLVSAKLNLRTDTQSIAGSIDAHQVTLAPSSWTETGLTWNNKPALGDTVGEIAPNTAVNSPVQATLDATRVAGAGSGAVSLAVTSTGSDNLWFWTRSHATATYRPSLVLTYEVP